MTVSAANVSLKKKSLEMASFGYVESLLVVFCYTCTILAGSSLGITRTPDWSCDFSSNDDCYITQEGSDDGDWKRYSSWWYDFYYADFNSYKDSEKVVCFLPSAFSSSEGKMAFRYQTSRGYLNITVCNDGPGEIRSSTGTTGWETTTVNISCPSTMNISFSAVSSAKYSEPDILIDDIEVWEEIPFTESPPTTWKPTMALTPSTATPTRSVYSTQMISSYQTTKKVPASQFVSTSMTTAYEGTTDVPTTDTTSMTSLHNFTTTASETSNIAETTQYSTSPGEENPKGAARSAIISVSVIGIFLMILVIAVIFTVNHRRRVPKENGSLGGSGKRSDDNAYTNAAFSAKDHVELNHPDVIRDAHLSNGSQTQHHPPSSTNPQGSSLHHLQQDDCNGYRGLDNSAMGQGEYMDLKHQGRMSHKAEEEGQDYFMLEGPGDEDSDGHHKKGTSSIDVDDQAYDHLNRGTGNSNIQNELREGHYGAAAVMSAEDEYNILVHGNEADINPTSSRPKPKEMAPQSGHGAGNEYQTLGLVDENDPMKYDDAAENHYNVLGETDEDAMGSSANTHKDTGSSDDYHVLHSGKETGDYHLYQHPEQELSSGSPADSSKPEDEDYTYYYPVVDGQVSGVTKESLPQGEGDDYYSVVNVQGQMDTSGVAGDTQHEPIYSSDVYSELV